MLPKVYDELASRTDIKDYSEVSKRLVKYSKEALELFKEMIILSIKADMLKKVVVYGLDPKSESYKEKLNKHQEALSKIEGGILNEKTLSSDKFARLFHYYVGANTETTEAITALLNWVLGVEELDEVNLAEEHGDTLWFLSRANNTINSSFEEQMCGNIAKLEDRYPEKYSDDLALNRNTDKERKTLEKKHKKTSSKKK